MVDKKLSFTVEDARLIKEDPNSSFSLVALDFFASGDNLHNLVVADETLMKTADTIKNCPVVWKYDAISQDATTHDSEEVPCGVVPESAEITSRKLEDGRTMLSTVSYIWKKYSGKILDFFKRDGEKPISVELTVLDQATNGDGREELLDYKFEAVTVLGNKVTPAIPLAHATVLQFAKEYQDAYNLEFSDKYADIDFTIPKSVKVSAQNSLEEYSKNNTSATSVSLAMARFLVKNEKINIQKLKSMAQFFGRTVEYDDITKGFYGGKSGSKWSKEIMEKVKEIDEKRLSYFEEGRFLTFPYSSISEAPENMKKLDGVALTLGQINHIAEVADAIGVDKKKNGYAIAKAQFKRSYHIEDDKWVKNKENMGVDEKEIEEFAKSEDLGKGDALGVDKSKDKVSSTPWGDVDKASLMHKVLGASNYKSLVHDVYLVVEEGWEDRPSSSLKYPVMQLVGDTFVYNKAGLSSALGRAKGQSEDVVASKVESIQKKLGLNKPEKEEYSVKIKKTQENKDAEVKFSLTASQITEILNSALSEYKYGDNDWRKYWVYNFDSEFVYFRDNEDDKEYRAKYAVENLVATVDLNSKEEVIEGMPMPVETKEYAPEFAEDEEPSNEGNDDGEDGEKGDGEDPEKKNMSLDANLDVAAYLAFLESTTEANEEMVAKYKTGEEFDYGKIFAVSKEKMCRMAEDLDKAKADSEAYMAMKEEFEALKQFKAEAQAANVAYAVESTIAEASDVLPKEKAEEFRNRAKDYSVDTVDALTNEIKAFAFSCSKEKKPNDGVVRIATGWVTPEKTNSLENGWVPK